MKRILAFLLCWTMLLSQLVMLAEAAKMQEQSDILYLQEQGVVVNEGGEIIMDQAPLGKPNDVERYAPSIPKFVPEALTSLGLMVKEEERTSFPAEFETEDAYEPSDLWVTYTGRFNKDKVMVYKYLGLDAESVWFNGTPDYEIELIETIDPTWYQLDCGFAGLEQEYSYVRAEDIDMLDKPPVRGITTTDPSGLMVRVEGIPSRNALRIATIPATKALTYKFGKNDPGIRTLLASCNLSVRSADGKVWQPEQEVEVFLTLPEIPELSERGTLYVLQQDSKGKVTFLNPTRYFLSNTISIKTSELSNYYVYSVDYPQMERYVELPPMGETTTLYHLFAKLSSSRPFADVTGISFEKPERIAVEPFFNEEIGMNDWKITVLTPSYMPLSFRILYKKDRRNKTSNEKFTFGSDLQISLGENLKYSIVESRSTEGFAARGTNTLRLGYVGGGTSERVTLTFDGDNAHMYVGNASDVLNLIVNSGENCDGSALVRGSYTGDLVQVAGTLHIDGGEKSFLHLSGDYRTGKTQALVRVVDGGRAYARSCYIEEAINNNSGGAVSVSEDGYFRAVETVHIENNQSVRGNGGGISSLGTVRLECDVVVGGNTAGKDGGGIYSSGRFYGAELLITENEATREGGGLCNDGGEVSLAGVEISYNAAENGGGIHQSGGSLAFYDSKAETNSESDEGKDSALRELLQYSASASIHGNKGKTRGGGILLQDGMIGVLITNGTQINIYQNEASYGGGMFLGGTTTAKTNVQLYRSPGGNGSFDVNRNTGTSNCGGVMMESCDLSVGVPMYIKHNTAKNCSGGGLFVGAGVAGYVYVVANAYIEIGGNTATNGGGFYLSGGSMTVESGITMLISNKGQTTTEWDYLANKANQASKGAGMYISSGSFYNKGTVNILNNTTTGSGDGGGMYLAGGSFTTAGALTIGENEAHEGGGIFLNGGTFETTGTSRPLIRGNNGEGSGVCHHGGGIHAERGTITINSTQELCVYRNYGQYGAGVFFGQHGGTVTINGTRNGEKSMLWVHENHDHTDANNKTADGAAIWIEACTVKLQHKLLVNRQAFGAADSAGNSGSSEGAFKIQNFVDGGTNKAGTLEITGELLIENCVGKNWSGGITLTWNGFVDVKSGGMLRVIGGGTPTGTTLVGGTSLSGSGGAIQSFGGTITNAGTIHISGCTGSYGGGIYLASDDSGNPSHLTSTGVLKVTDSTARTNGGGIYITGAGATFSIAGSENAIDRNTAGESGGGIYSYGTPVSITGGSVGYNIAQHQGGGIYLHRTDLTVSGGTNFHHNETKTNHGGGIYSFFGNVTLGENTKVQNNTAYFAGGGIYFYNRDDATERTLRIGANSEISGNVASNSQAGGVQVDNAKIILEDGVQICDNHARGTGVEGAGGGAYLIEAELEMKGSASIHGNTAVLNGGGVHLRSGSISMNGTSSIYGNSTEGNGGGVHINDGSITVSGTPSIYGNTAVNGGGIYSAVALTLSSGVTVGHETDATKGNRASNHGGGIHCAEDVTVTDAKVYHNSAGGNGGGICVADQKKVTLSGSGHVDGNSAGNKGGGVYINTGEITTASTTTVTFNNNHAANGGGLYLNSASAILTNAQFTNNKALAFGGGIYSTGTMLTLNSSNSFDGNMAGVDQNGNTVNGCEGSGGGIWFGGSDKTLTLNAVEMKNNSAYRGANTTDHGNGGALYVASSSLHLKGAVKIHDNYADSAFGGGICLRESSLAVTVVSGVSPHIYSNSALSGGGICVVNTQAVDWSSLSITVGGETAAEGNTADSGGGISAIGTSLTIGPNVIVRNNTADDGGGIYIKRSNGAEIPTLTIKPNTVISKNTAKTNGGGLYAYLANVEINENVSIIDNKTTSGHGGGLFVYRPHNAHTYNASTGAVTVTEVYPIPTLKMCGTAQAPVCIQNNYSGSQGGGLYIFGSHLIMEHCNVINNDSAKMGGGLLAVSYGDVTYKNADGTVNYKLEGNLKLAEMQLNLKNSTIQNNVSGSNAGGIYAEGYGLLKFDTVSITQNKTTGYGGGMVLSMKGNKPTIVNCTISENKASGDGGGAYIYNIVVEEAVLSQNTITNNEAGGNGGGLWLNGAWIKIDGTNTISGNSAGKSVVVTRAETASENGGNGGGIYFTGSGRTLTLQGATINNNHALSSGETNGNGGGIYMNAGTKLAVIGNSNPTAAGVESSYIIGNTATNNGGGLYVAGGSEGTEASKIDIATSIPTKVGGKDHEVDLMVGDDNESTGNHAANGGGIYLSGGVVTLTGDHELYVRQNTATADGGAMVLNGTTLTIEKIGAVVSGNTADGNGGAIVVMSNATMKETSMARFNIFRNKAKINGGGIWCAGKIETNGMRIGYMTATEKNYAPNRAVDGGGLYLTENGSFIATGNVYVANNEASGNGGGIYTKAALTVNSYLMVGYLATATNVETECGNVAKYGGGIYIDGATVALNGATVQYNRAEQDGGGIYVKVGTANLNGATIDSNYAGISKSIDISQIEAEGFDYSTIDGGYGGGVYVAEGAAMTMNGGTISNNGAYAEAAERGDGYGGGLFVATDATATLQSGTISKNYAYGKDNYSLTAMGGGVYTQGIVEFTGDFTISENESSRYGGGFYQTNGDSKTTISAGVTVDITDNKAIWGGGMAFGSGEVAGTGEFIAEGILHVVNNEATKHGGGIYMANGAVTLKNQSEIENNTAGTSGGGICMDGAETMSVKLEGSSQITGNTAGGNGGGVWMNNGTLTLDGKDVAVTSNYAQNGGGVYMNDGVLKMNGSTISNHSLTKKDATSKITHGGGICLKGGDLILNGATIQNNEVAGNGGGIYMTGGTLTDTVEDSTVQSVTQITGNKSDRNGGGLYCENVDVGLSHTVFNGNVATATLGNDNAYHGGCGGGIFFTNTNGSLNTLTLSGVELKNNQALSISVVNDGKTEHIGGRGGAIAVENSNLLIKGATGIHDNYAQRNGGGVSILRKNNDGTTVYAVPRMTVEGTAEQYIRIQNNTAGHQGGGLYVYGCHLDASYMDLYHNASANHGGGMLLVSYQVTPETEIPNLTLSEMECRLEHCEITSNTSGAHAGGAWIEGYQHEDVQISDTNMTGNLADNNGGALYLRYTKLTLAGTNVIAENRAGVSVTEEEATSGYYSGGGGIFVHEDSELTVNAGTTISNNFAVEAGANRGSGGGIYATSASGSDTKVYILGGDIFVNTAKYGAGIYAANAEVHLSGGGLYSNTATNTGGGVYLYKASLTMTGGEIQANSAWKFGGGIYVGEESTLTVSGFDKSPIRNNTAGIISGENANWNQAAGNDIYALGKKTLVTMGPTTDGRVEEHWFADYKWNDASYPGVPVFSGTYAGTTAHPGRYDANVTPVSFARRSFGEAFDEAGAAAASKATLALTLGEARYMNLTLTKELANGETAVENTTFIFYLKGVDNEKFLLPVTINLAEGATDGTVTLTDIPLGYYDICEDEGWSWRYDPSTAAYTEQGKGVFHRVNNGDDYLRVQTTISESTSHAVTFTNGIENVRWLSDALYMPFLTPAKVNVDPAEDEEETE